MSEKSEFTSANETFTTQFQQHAKKQPQHPPQQPAEQSRAQQQLRAPQHDYGAQIEMDSTSDKSSHLTRKQLTVQKLPSVLNDPAHQVQHPAADAQKPPPGQPQLWQNAVLQQSQLSTPLPKDQSIVIQSP